MITSEQQTLPPNLLVGFCETDQQWYKFDNQSDPDTCPDCGGRPSHKNGYQLTTQRTFDPSAKKLTKAQLKKMGISA